MTILRRIMEVRRVSLPTAICGILAEENSHSLDDWLIILPTIESGRRVLEELVTSTGLVFPPKFSTPLGLIPFGKGEGVATTTQACLAWRKVLENSTDCCESFPHTADPALRRSFGGDFVDLTRSLATAGFEIPDAAKLLQSRDARWSEWITLWSRYQKELGAVGLRCPARSQCEAARDFALPPGIRRTLIAGVLDLPPLAQMALQNHPITFLHYAPALPLADDAFAEDGHPLPTFWQNHLLEIPDSCLEVVSEAGNLSEAVARCASSCAGRVAIFSGDAGLSQEIAAALAGHDLAAFLPEGRPLNEHPIPRLARLLCALAAGGTWLDMEVLLQHPDFLDHLEQRNIFDRRAAASWQSLGTETFQSTLQRLFQHECTSRSPCAVLVEEFQRLTLRLRSENAGLALREILAEIYNNRDLARRPGDKDAAKNVVAMLDEILACGSLGQLPAGQIGALLSDLSGTWNVERPSAPMEVCGWLELAGENATTILIAGLNEGMLPSTRQTDSLLPDAAREVLGLDTAASRQLRDKAMLTFAVASRAPQDVKVFSCQAAYDGSPLKPSRLLLQVTDASLAERVELLCKPVRSQRAETVTCGFSTHPLRIPRAASPATRMRVTAFASYLACPLRFYLSHRLGWNGPDRSAARLDASSFGRRIHEVFRDFGRGEARDSEDEETIRTDVLQRWDAGFVGLENNVDLELQREAGRMRLEEFARIQAGHRREGWIIERTEWNFSDATKSLPDWDLALTGQIDRVDRRGDELRLIDYKTSAAHDPKAHHLAKADTKGRSNDSHPLAHYGEHVWVDLQLPLYAIAARHAGLAGSNDRLTLAYFSLPSDVAGSCLSDWIATEEDLASAETCARSIALEVAQDRVLDRIEGGDFSAFAFHPKYDDFECLALSRYLEAGALEVAP